MPIWHCYLIQLSNELLQSGDSPDIIDGNALRSLQLAWVGVFHSGDFSGMCLQETSFTFLVGIYIISFEV